nr:SHOCT domain-containing protein [Halomarina rubra]
MAFGDDRQQEVRRRTSTALDDVVQTAPTRSTDAGEAPMVDSDGPTTDDALAELRRRYAAGELSEPQFEGRVERLLADEDDPDDARAVLELRYARGELSDEQFDRKLARLDGTRTVESAERTFDRDAVSES